MGDLPESIKAVFETAQRCPAEVWSQVPHRIQFVYGSSASADDAMAVDLLESEGALPIPSEGGVIGLRGIIVRVAEVITRFEVQDGSGTPSIFATVRVEPIEVP